MPHMATDLLDESLLRPAGQRTFFPASDVMEVDGEEKYLPFHMVQPDAEDNDKDPTKSVPESR